MSRSVALVHDYLTQRGGAERVVLSMLKAFPGAPLYTSLYDPKRTFPKFAEADVRTLPLNRIAPLCRRHRFALPLLAHAFSSLEVSADVVLCSSSGWAHGVRARGRKIVYCYSPARWLYHPESYRGGGHRGARAAITILRPYLLRWDRQAAASAHRYLTLSSAVRDRIRDVYGIEAEVLPPPHGIDATGPRRMVDGVEPGFLLCVSRLLPYKNVAAVVSAFSIPGTDRLVVVGSGPEEGRLRAGANGRVRFLGSVSDAELRWLYANCLGVVSASYEDYGLTPLEAGAFGKPAAVLRWGGFLETVLEGATGVFFDAPEPAAIRTALQQLMRESWSPAEIRAHADTFSEERFLRRLREIADEEPARAALEPA
jgi:glycosyltransferase involved in cell wall biosynthesis